MLPITRATAQSFCRSCLVEFAVATRKKSEPGHDIHQEKDLEKWFRVTTDLTSISNSVYPQKLCHTCYVKSRTFYQFREKTICSTLALISLIDEHILSESLLANLQGFCRTCLKKIGQGQPNMYYNEQLRDWLLSCCGVRILVNSEDELSHLPRYLCSWCYKKLRNFVEFRGVVKQNDAYIQDVLDGEEEKEPKVLEDIKPVKEAESPPEIASNLFVEQLPILATEGKQEPSENGTDTNEDSGDDMASASDEEAEEEPPLDEAAKGTNGTIQCKLCEKRFRKKIMHEAHVLRDHKGIKKPFFCEHCPKSYRMHHFLVRHLRETHNILSANGNVREFKCGICCKAFKRKDHMEDHVSSVHEKLKRFKCSYCDKAFAARKTWRVHEMSHTGERPFKCDFCEKTFRQKPDLKIHRERHTTSPELLCPICKRARSTVEELKEHIAWHDAQNRHQCPKCGRVFKKKCQLDEHDSSVHLQLYKYKCSQCSRCFKFRRDWNNHQKNEHLGDQKFECQICHKTYPKPVALQRHLRKHEKNDAKKQAIVGT